MMIGPFSGMTNFGKNARKKNVIFGFVMQKVNPRTNCFAAVSDFVLSPLNLFFDAVNAFKKALDKLSGVYQSRTFSGMQWHGIQPVIQF